MLYDPASWRIRVRVAPTIVLTEEERDELTKLARSKLSSVRLALRARMVLLPLMGCRTKTSPSD